MNRIIETDHFLLRSLIPEDIEPLFRIQSDPKAMKYTIWTNSIEETKKRLEAYSKEEAKKGFAPWTIIAKADNEVIGWGGLNIDPFDPGWGIEVFFSFTQNIGGKDMGLK